MCCHVWSLWCDNILICTGDALDNKVSCGLLTKTQPMRDPWLVWFSPWDNYFFFLFSFFGFLKFLNSCNYESFDSVKLIPTKN